jgi:hypothetical protein
MIFRWIRHDLERERNVSIRDRFHGKMISIFVQRRGELFTVSYHDRDIRESERGNWGWE